MTEGKTRFERYISRVVKRCAECRKNPVVYIQAPTEKVGVCAKHWKRLVYMDWG